MIRLLHFADFHLGMENYGRLDTSTGLSSRVSDFLRTLDHMVEVALSDGIDAVVFAGDAYKSRDPSLTYQREFSQRIGKLAAKGVSVVLLVGNHDLPNAIGRATPLDIYDTLAIERIHVFAQPKSQTIATRSGPLQIVGLPWVRRDNFVTPEALKTRSIDDLDLELNQALADWIAGQAEELDHDTPAILIAHASIEGATYGSERKVLFGRDLVLTKAAVDRPEFAYVALGHIHKQQVLGTVTPVVYPGSVERIDFGEEKEEKGYMLVEVEAGRTARYQFRRLASRSFVTVEVVLSETDPTETVLAAMRARAIKGGIVRVQVEGTADQLKTIRRNEIVAAARDAHYFAGLQQIVTQDSRRRDLDRWSEGMPPREVLLHYFESKKFSAERLRKLMEVADELMAARE
jgi:exonuclease SbcD